MCKDADGAVSSSQDCHVIGSMLFSMAVRGCVLRGQMPGVCCKKNPCVDAHGIGTWTVVVVCVLYGVLLFRLEGC